VRTRRSHGRVRDDLPPEIREQVDRLLIEPGITYDDIKAHLAEQGYDISRSAIGRYGKDFLNVYQQLKVIEDKSKALVSKAGDGMILEEAASKLFSQMILEAQMSGELDIKTLPRIISDFAKLQTSTVLRERLKKELVEKVRKQALEDAANAMGKTAKQAGVSDETIKIIRRDVLRMAG
jgi:Bacteriophage Mu, Gp27